MLSHRANGALVEAVYIQADKALDLENEPQAEVRGM